MEFVVEKGGGIKYRRRPTGSAEDKAGDVGFDPFCRLNPNPEFGLESFFTLSEGPDDQEKTYRSQRKNKSCPDPKRCFPAECLGKISSGDESDEDPNISRTTLDTHGKVKALVRVSFGHPGYSDRMIEACENPHQDIKKKKGDENRGSGDEKERDRETHDTEEQQMFIFHFVGDVGGDDMEDERCEEAEVRQDPDVGIFGDDILLAVEEGEDHRDGHRGGIVQTMEERS